MKNKRLFFVKIKDCSSEYYWYSNCVGYIFLVSNDKHDRKKYELASGGAWLDKKDCVHVSISAMDSSGNLTHFDMFKPKK